MTLSIRHPKADRLARELAARTGKSITAVVMEALADYAVKAPPSTTEEKRRGMQELFREWDQLPVVDPRSAQEIMDDFYDEDGLPK